MANKIFAITSY